MWLSRVSQQTGPNHLKLGHVRVILELNCLVFGDIDRLFPVTIANTDLEIPATGEFEQLVAVTAYLITFVVM